MKHKLSFLVLALFTVCISSAFTVKNIQSDATNFSKDVRLLGGDWVIGNYYDGKANQTETVSAYSFTFNADASISIYHGGAVGYPGQYTMTSSTMSFWFNQSDLAPLNGDWQIVSSDDTSIKLARDNSQLVFLKNGNPGTPSDLQ